MSKKELTLSAANVAFANTIVQQLDVLSVRREQWETTDYKKANDGLYALLADCLAVFNERFVKGSEQDQIALRRNLMQRLQADGIRVVKTSTTLTMLARFVFNSDRKRAQGYGYVLAAAVSHKVQAADFPAWVLKQGGLEEIKRLMVKKPEAIAKLEAVKVATKAIKGELEDNTAKPLAQVGLAGLSGDYAVLLVKPNVKGGADVIGALSDINEALVNTLIERMAKAQVASAEANKELLGQVQRDSDLLAAANDMQISKVVNG
ncbi:MAG: hypothetical protein RLZ63_287 [Pseudomonadota bacterium]|jgi:hypothetical protein